MTAPAKALSEIWNQPSRTPRWSENTLPWRANWNDQGTLRYGSSWCHCQLLCSHPQTTPTGKMVTHCGFVAPKGVQRQWQYSTKSVLTVIHINWWSSVNDPPKRIRTMLAKLDLQSPYRIIPVHPQDCHLLGMQFDGNLYVDTALPFGLRFSTQNLQSACWWSAVENDLSRHPSSSALLAWLHILQ